MTYTELGQDIQTKLSAIFKDLDVFFAFGDKQFEEGLAKIKATKDEVTSIMGGGIIPKKNATAYTIRSNNLMAWHAKEVKKLDQDEVIEYELANHECYYTGDIYSAYEVLKAFDITREQVQAVYMKNRSNHYDD